MFKAKTGIDVSILALGTGQALDAARRGDADVVFVHAKAEEEKFIADGFGGFWAKYFRMSSGSHREDHLASTQRAG
jgi:ABC-type tungstate transport system permease subunit